MSYIYVEVAFNYILWNVTQEGCRCLDWTFKFLSRSMLNSYKVQWCEANGEKDSAYSVHAQNDLPSRILWLDEAFAHSSAIRT